MTDAVDDRDAETFLWQFERELHHLPGDRRIALVRKAESMLRAEVDRIADASGERPEWYHVVQAIAALGPPEELARSLTGGTIPTRRAATLPLILGAAAVALLGVVLFVSLLQPTPELRLDLGGTETGLSTTIVHQIDAPEGVGRARMFFFPEGPDSAAVVVITDAEGNRILERVLTRGAAGDMSQGLTGAAGAWRIELAMHEYTGAWRLQVFTA